MEQIIHYSIILHLTKCYDIYWTINVGSSNDLHYVSEFLEESVFRPVPFSVRTILIVILAFIVYGVKGILYVVCHYGKLLFLSLYRMAYDDEHRE